MTGSGKTSILHEIKRRNEQVLDLEALANHKGSAFGSLGEKMQPLTEQFENNLFTCLKSFDSGKPIWVEDESRNIGRVVIPAELYNKMKDSPTIIMDIDRSERIRYLVDIYGNFPDGDLKDCINKISKRLGGLKTSEALESVENKDYRKVADLVLDYYDKTYRFGLNKKAVKNIHYIRTQSVSPQKNAELILNFYMDKQNSELLLR
jgi:tRNA 2-selenouridine synthase